MIPATAISKLRLYILRTLKRHTIYWGYYFAEMGCYFAENWKYHCTNELYFACYIQLLSHDRMCQNFDREVIRYRWCYQISHQISCREPYLKIRITVPALVVTCPRSQLPALLPYPSPCGLTMGSQGNFIWPHHLTIQFMLTLYHSKSWWSNRKKHTNIMAKSIHKKSF